MYSPEVSTPAGDLPPPIDAPQQVPAGLQMVSPIDQKEAALRAFAKRTARVPPSSAGLATIPDHPGGPADAADSGSQSRLPPYLEGDMTPQLLGLEAI